MSQLMWKRKDEVSNKAKIHFIITEGGQIRIKQIKFME